MRSPTLILNRAAVALAAALVPVVFTASAFAQAPAAPPAPVEPAAPVAPAPAAPAPVPGAARDTFDRMTIWDLKLGTPLAEMPDLLAYKDYACGSNGGPPRLTLAGWQDFAMCPVDPTSGLYEVYFEYDDEAEFVLRAHTDQRAVLVTGTTDKEFPVTTSALFDADGVLRGVRLMTDPRADYTADEFFDLGTMRLRQDHYLLGPFLAAQFLIRSSEDCVALPLAADEETIGGSFTKLDCDKADPANHLRYILQTRFLRKPGQLGRDPITGALTTGQFESWTRAEIYAEGYGPAGSILDRVNGTPPIAGRASPPR